MPDPATIRLVDPDGVVRDVPADSAGSVLADPRWRVANRQDELSRISEQAKEETYGGAGGAAKAGLAGVARGVTLGGSDLAARLLGGEDAAIGLEGLRDVNPGVSFGSELLGAVAPALLTGGAATPAGLAARAGRGVTAAAGGGVRGALAGGAVEGALYGVGGGVTELSLSQDPLTLERAASTLSSGALFGAAAGAAGGLAAHGVEAGLGKAKGAIDGWLDQRAAARTATAEAEAKVAAANAPAAIGPETDVTLLDRKGLKVARDQELEAIRTAQVPERHAFVDDLVAAREAAKEEKTWIATAKGKTREVREIGRATLDADRRIDKLLKVEKDLTERPERALSALREQEQALTGLRDWGEQETQRYLDEVAGARDKIRSELAGKTERYFDELAGARDKIRGELVGNKIDGYRVGKGGISPSSPVIDDIIEREFARRYPHAPRRGQIPETEDLVEREFARRYPNPDRLPTNLEVLGGIPGQLERNKALQDRLARMAESPASPRLAAIDAADEAIATRVAAPKVEPTPSLGHEVLSAVAPFAGPLGAVASSGMKALGGLRKAAGAAAEQAAKAGSRFLDVAGQATAKASPYAPVVASKVLGSLSYASKDDAPPPRMRQVEDSDSKLATVYRKRTDEIKGQVELAPDGSYQMRQDARMKLAAKFDGIRHLDPHAADDLETIGARRIAYLASIIPRRPDIGGIPIGPDRWQPNDMAMRSFARSAGAVEDPHAVLDRAAAGRVVPEEAAALRAVYPELLSDFTGTVVAQLPSLRKTLPYKRRLALSLLTGTPVDAAMTPAVLSEIQGMYAAEPGTAGGTQAPQAQAQFGSLKRSDPGTPAQRREGLTT